MTSKAEFLKDLKESKERAVRRAAYSRGSGLDIEKEFEILENAANELLGNKEAAFNFLVEGGFLTKTGKLPKKYRS
jgi:hypothetical protein